MQAKATIKDGLKSQLLSDMSGILMNAKWRRELIDVMNKHIHHGYENVIRQIPYSVSNMALAEYLKAFLTIRDASFNRDLGILTQRYLSQNYSNASGFAYASDITSTGTVNQIITEISNEASSGQAGEKVSEDAIKISLINKGIVKKRLIKRSWIFIVVFVVIAIVLLYFLLKSTRKNRSTQPVPAPVPVDNTGEGEGEPAPAPGPEDIETVSE